MDEGGPRSRQPHFVGVGNTVGPDRFISHHTFPAVFRADGDRRVRRPRIRGVDDIHHPGLNVNQGDNEALHTGWFGQDDNSLFDTE